MKKLSTLKYLRVLLLSILSVPAMLYAQVNISGGTTVSEPFNIGTTATATLPSGWKADNPATVRTLGTYTAAGSATSQTASQPSTSAANGIYNFGSGTTNTTSDRAVGGISSGTASKSVNIYVDLLNNGANNIGSLTISYNVEKYRKGSNAAGFSIQMYYSSDGTNWTSAGANFLTSFAADADNINYSPSPGVTSSVSLKTLTSLVNTGSHFYLAWNYSVTTGTTTTNAQGLGIDDITITANTSISSNANLSNLTLSSGTLTPTFTSGTTNYTASVASNISSITVTPTASESHATISVNGNAVTSGNPSSAIALIVGDNVVTTVVTAQDATTTKSYTVTVTRATPGVPALTATTLGDFGNVCINTTAGPNSFSLNGINLDGTNISVEALPAFTYSESADGPYTNSLSFSYTGDNFSGKVIYVKFTPTSVQSYNGNINVSGGGVGNYDVAATGAGINSGPSITNGNSSAVTATTATLTDTITVAGCSAITSYGFEYSLSTGFANGTGTQVLSSNLSAGIFSATVTGLTPNQQYFYKAFAATGSGTTYGTQRSFINAPLPVTMASQPGLNYTEDFHDIANWSNFFITGIGANHFDGLSSNSSVPGSGIPNGSTITTSTNSFQSGTPSSPSVSGGVHKGTDQPTPTQSIVLLSTGSTVFNGSPDNSTSAAIDFYLDFTGVNAGTLSFDFQTISNALGAGANDRAGSLRVYASTNGTTFTEITSASVLNFINKTPISGSRNNITLPAMFNNNPNARLRFYYYNGTGGTNGSRPKISIDNINITAVPSTPCSTPTAQPSSMVFGTITDVSIAGNFSAQSPASDQYLTVVSTNSSLTSTPIDGTVYNVGDAFGDGTVIAKGSSLNFTATGLSPATTYYFFTYAVNGICTGGPKYLTADPLINSATTNSPLPPCAVPSSQAANLVFENVSINFVHGSFTPTTADEYLVLVSTDPALTSSPINGIAYNSGDVLGNATVIQRSSATTFTASGLAPGTQYYFFIFSLNSQNCLNGPTYNTVEPLSGAKTTQPLPPCSTPTSQPTLLTLNAANNSISGTFNGSNSADDYLVVRSTSSTLNSSPVDATDYNIGASLGGGIIVSNSSATSFVTNNVSSGTTYYFFVFAANKNCSGGTKYLTASPLTGSATTTSFVQNNYYFGTLHSHSDYSDGNKDHPGFTPADDYNYAMTAQCLDFLGISEHNHFSSPDNPGNTITNYHKGPIQADSFTNVHPNFLALYGMEWGVISGGGHVVIYGDGMDKLFGWESGNGGWGPTDNYDVYVPKSVYTGSTGLFKTVNDFKDQNTFATLAHPNQSDFNNLAGISYDPVADSAIVGSAVESGPATSTNTSYTNPGSSMSYLWYYQTLLSKGYHLGPTIDHDNHNTTFGHTTFARTAVIAPVLNKTEIIKAMHDMHFYSTEDCDSKVDFTINTKMMGSVFSGRNAPAISVTLSDLTTSTSSAIIRVMYGKPGSGVMPVKIDSAIGNTLSFVDNNLPNGETGYYYIDITNGTSRIVTSPIWYTRTCSVESNTTIYSCNSYDWNGQTYTQSGTYVKTGMISTGGCDSTAVLHLTITTPTTGDTTAVACNSFTWYGTTYTSSGTPTKVLKERGGCDSTVTLHLTINHSSQPTSFDTSGCTSLKLPWSDTPVTTSGDYSHTYTNSNGCDSVVTAHVTINQIPSVSITPGGPTTFCPGGLVNLTATSAASYLWSNSGSSQTITVNETGNYSVTITDANGCSNTSAPITITVQDITPPDVHTQNISVALGAGGSVSITPSQINNGSTDNCSIAENGYALDKTLFDCTNVGQNTVTLTVTDVNGNHATGTATVTVNDNIVPTITCPADVTATTNTGCTATGVDLGSPSIADNCSVKSISNDHPSTTYPLGVTTVTWIVTDGSGNTATCTQSVIISDNVNPVITCPNNITVVPVGLSGTKVVFATPAATDNCSIATVNQIAGLPSGSTFPVGSSIIKYQVIDGSGNSSTCSFTITVTDPYCDRTPNNQKVYVCHNGNTICISVNALQAHLNHGDYLGSCATTNAITRVEAQGVTPGTAPAVAGTNINGKTVVISSEIYNVIVAPNPSTNYFKILVETNSSEPVNIRITDALGRVVTTIAGFQKNALKSVGANFHSGTYFAEVTQGIHRKTIKLVKLN